MITDQLKQNQILDLPGLDNFRYENLFNVYQNRSNQYFYNILSKVNFPSNLDSNFFDTYTIPNNNMPYTLISYKLYGSILLWWVICSVNNITNPVFFPQAGTKLKILKPAIVSAVIQQLNNNV
jgi:hypothetical protein